MRGAIDFHYAVRRGNQRHGRLQLISRGEGVARAVHEERGFAETLEMLGAKFRRFVRRVKRIGKKQQAVGGILVLRNQH